MKMSGAYRTPGLFLGLLASFFCPGSFAAAPDDVALAQQKAAIQVMDNARQEYLKTGDVARFRARLDQPARDLSAGLGEFNRARNSAAAGVSLQKLGEIYRLQEKYPAAFVYFLTAIAESETASDKKTHALALIGQGRCELVSTKDYKSAGAHFREAAEVAATLDDRAPLFNALSWQAQVEVSTGNLIGGADLLGRAFALGPQLQDRSLLLFAYLDRADIFEKLAEKSGASKAFQTQLEGLQAAKTDYAAALQMAQQFGYVGISDQIEQFLRHLAFRRQMTEMNVRFAKTLAQNNVFAPKKPTDVLVNESFVAGQTDLPAGLIELVQKEHVLEGGDARTLVTRGQFHAMAGEADAALADYVKAADALESDRRKLRDEKSREKFFDDKIVFYYPAISELLQRKRFAEAFALMERSRSRAMADLIFSKKLTLAQPDEQTLFAETQRLRAEIADEQKILFTARTRPPDPDLAKKIKATEERIAQLEKAERELAAKIAKIAPRLRELTVAQPASLERVQEMLRKDGSEMLYYLALDDGLVLWHIAGQSQHARSVFLPRSELKAKVAALRKSVATPDATFDEKTARELFLYLIQPALGWIKGTQLILVPHAELHDLAFAALIAPSGKSLGEMFGLSDAPNAGLLLDLKKGDAIGQARLFAAADPGIEAARGEVEGVAAFYPERNKTLVDSLVAESEVKASAGQSDVLHLSVHGKFTPSEPMLSYLQLGKDARDDGRLTAAEMFGLSLGKARLVVLSACETGQAEATPGNEVLGMERALLYAGANNLVLSSWAVDAASTALWMKTFHREAQTKPLAEAARLALIETKKKYPQPYYWAAFRLVGR
ncbi:MAG TPA: CHAT domain-containing protein [Chthoniobacterales bacterium]|jgi:CHAT domain-containing protein|nr:CHAT domain-containing protein [Chthoniobacterales bacterium]